MNRIVARLTICSTPTDNCAASTMTDHLEFRGFGVRRRRLSPPVHNGKAPDLESVLFGFCLEVRLRMIHMVETTKMLLCGRTRFDAFGNRPILNRVGPFPNRCCQCDSAHRQVAVIELLFEFEPDRVPSEPSLPVKPATGRAVPFPTISGFWLLANDAPRGVRGNCANSRLPHRPTTSDR